MCKEKTEYSEEERQAIIEQCQLYAESMVEESMRTRNDIAMQAWHHTYNAAVGIFRDYEDAESDLKKAMRSSLLYSTWKAKIIDLYMIGYKCKMGHSALDIFDDIK